MTIQTIILAAGQGKRMHSDLPKVLHTVAGKPLLQHVIDVAFAVAPDAKPLVVYGHQGDVIRRALAHANAQWVEQTQQLGTAHAVLQALPGVDANARVLILYGDVPLISTTTLKKLIDTTPSNAIGMITARVSNPTGYGRIKRDAQQQVIGIVEEKDATDAERAINEINTGIYVVPATYLKKWLPTIKNNNAQKEYYLTDIVTHAVQEKIAIHTVEPTMTNEILGVNDRVQLAQLERAKQSQLAEKLMQQGVTLRDPARIDIRGNVKVGRDVIIDVNVILEGDVVIGDSCVIGANSIVRNSTLGNSVTIHSHSVLEESKVGDGSIVGPFARLRPGTVLDNTVHIGNFVEIKNSQIKSNSKVNHLSYIGDSEIGARVNVGAGTITCNYDGANKHQTIIGDDVFIGSDTQLVAPVKVNNGATIAAGSTITKEVPANQLTLTHRLEQRSSKEWKRPEKVKE